MSRSIRFLKLLQAMRDYHQPVTAAHLADLLEVSERTINRDVADLAAQGAPIEGEAGIGYILRPGLFLPPLMLSEDEVEAVMLGLRYVDQRGDAVLKGAAASTKIAAVLPPDAAMWIAQPVAVPGPGGPCLCSGAPVAVLRAAIRRHLRLRILYADEQDRRTERVAWPLQVGFLDRARVLFAWCELRDDFRTFRIDRVAVVAELDRYPPSRADLVRRLKAHLAEQTGWRMTPDGD